MTSPYANFLSGSNSLIVVQVKQLVVPSFLQEILIIHARRDRQICKVFCTKYGVSSLNIVLVLCYHKALFEFMAKNNLYIL